MPEVKKHLVDQNAARISMSMDLIRGLQFSHVLELGAGDFSFRTRFAENEAFRWTSADFSGQPDVRVDLNVPKVSLPFADGSVDLVIATQLLEHLLWPQTLLRECWRVMSARGSILISVPNIVSLSYRLSWLLGRIPSCAACGNLPNGLGPTTYCNEESEYVGGHVIDFNMERITSLLVQTGFRVDKIQGSGLYWRKQILPAWLLPASLASNIIVLASRRG